MNRMPSVQTAMVERTGAIARGWAEFLQYVSKIVNGMEPLPLKACSVVDLPDPQLYRATMIYVADEVGGAVPAFSDGVNWRRVTDRNIVS